MISTPLKNISQNGNLPQIGVKIKNIETTTWYIITTDSTNNIYESVRSSVTLGNARKQDSEHVLSLLDGYRENFLKQTHVLQPCTWIFRTEIMKRRDFLIYLFFLCQTWRLQKTLPTSTPTTQRFGQTKTVKNSSVFWRPLGGVLMGRGEYRNMCVVGKIPYIYASSRAKN